MASSAMTSKAIVAGSRTLSRRILPAGIVATTCSSHDIPSSSQSRSLDHITRPLTSFGNYGCGMPSDTQPSITQGPSSSSLSLSYSMLRNMATEVKQEENFDYVSPYADLFDNMAAGRTALGSTEDDTKQGQQQRYLDCGIPESDLIFRTTSFGRFQLAPHVSPGEHRVTVRVPLASIPFENETEKRVFLEIVGPRYKAEKEVLQLSSEKFASRIENKRYLVGMLERIVASARRLAKDFAEEDQEEKTSVV